MTLMTMSRSPWRLLCNVLSYRGINTEAFSMCCHTIIGKSRLLSVESELSRTFQGNVRGDDFIAEALPDILGINSF